VIFASSICRVEAASRVAISRAFSSSAWRARIASSARKRACMSLNTVSLSTRTFWTSTVSRTTPQPVAVVSSPRPRPSTTGASSASSSLAMASLRWVIVSSIERLATRRRVAPTNISCRMSPSFSEARSLYEKLSMRKVSSGSTMR
jgi:hypothetical protein